MIPKKIEPYFEITHQTKARDNLLVEGVFTCCDSHDFDVFVIGKVKRNLFLKMYLTNHNEKIAVEIRCRKCGKVISVFDSSCDGYGQCGKKQSTNEITKVVDCKKCQSTGYSVIVKYEYPDIQELKDLQITEIDNAFTWIWITLECNTCKTRYKKFVDYETA